jgi:hypothetical protein
MSNDDTSRKSLDAPTPGAVTVPIEVHPGLVKMLRKAGFIEPGPVTSDLIEAAIYGLIATALEAGVRAPPPEAEAAAPPPAEAAPSASPAEARPSPPPATVSPQRSPPPSAPPNEDPEAYRRRIAGRFAQLQS